MSSVLCLRLRPRRRGGYQPPADHISAQNRGPFVNGPYAPGSPVGAGLPDVPAGTASGEENAGRIRSLVRIRPTLLKGCSAVPPGRRGRRPLQKSPSLACCLPLPASGRGAARRRRGAACPGVVPLSVPSGQLSPAFRRGEPSGFALILPASHPPRLSVGAGVLDGPLSPPPPGKAPRCAHRAEGGSPRPCGGTQRNSLL